MTEIKVNLYDKTEVISDEPATVISPDKTEFALVPFARQKLGFSYDEHGYEAVTEGGKCSVVRFYPSQKSEYVLRFSRRRPFALPFQAAKTAAMFAQTKRTKDISYTMTESRFSQSD